MVRIDKDYVFEGADGKVSLLDLFEGRRQLIISHFMFAPGVEGWSAAGCPGCSFFVDQIGHLAHLHARDTAFSLVSRAPLANIERYKKRMGWTVPWFSSSGSGPQYRFQCHHRRRRDLWPERLPARSRRGLSHLLHFRARRRRARHHLELPGSDAPRAGRKTGRIRLRAGRNPRRTNGGAVTTSTSIRMEPRATEEFRSSRMNDIGGVWCKAYEPEILI